DEVFYNEVDDDCNEATADADKDGDGYDANNVRGDDCDDENPRVNPGKTEIGNNGVDDDCNARTTDNDVDGDGAPIGTDCDDSNAARYPGATEVNWNNIDENCDNFDVDLDTCVEQGVQEAMAYMTGYWDVPQMSGTKYLVVNWLVGASDPSYPGAQYLSFTTDSVDVGPQASGSWPLTLGTTVAVNDPASPFYMELSLGDNFLACYAYIDPQPVTYTGDVRVTLNNRNMSINATVDTAQTPFVESNFHLTGYQNASICSLSTISLLVAAAGYNFSALSFAEDAGTQTFDDLNGIMEEQIETEVRTACAPPSSSN
ncbi:MAG: hypothetical protein RLZZ299_2028, partial [Pseudomonadota bacterium]